MGMRGKVMSFNSRASQTTNRDCILRDCTESVGKFAVCKKMKRKMTTAGKKIDGLRVTEIETRSTQNGSFVIDFDGFFSLPLSSITRKKNELLKLRNTVSLFKIIQTGCLTKLKKKKSSKWEIYRVQTEERKKKKEWHLSYALKKNPKKKHTLNSFRQKQDRILTNSQLFLLLH